MIFIIQIAYYKIDFMLTLGFIPFIFKVRCIIIEKIIGSNPVCYFIKSFHYPMYKREIFLIKTIEIY